MKKITLLTLVFVWLALTGLNAFAVKANSFDIYNETKYQGLKVVGCFYSYTNIPCLGDESHIINAASGVSLDPNTTTARFPNSPTPQPAIRKHRRYRLTLSDNVREINLALSGINQSTQTNSDLCTIDFLTPDQCHAESLLKTIDCSCIYGKVTIIDN